MFRSHEPSIATISLCSIITFCSVLSSSAAASSQRGPPLPSTHIDLSSFKWKLVNANRSITVPTPFLNQPHLALIDAGIINEPNIGLNEGTVRWVGEEDSWTWYTNFTLDTGPEWKKVDRFYLNFNGLDTFCDIQLGGHLIGSTNNAFRSWVFDATEAIQASLNQSLPTISLSLRFASAWGTATRLARQPGNTWFPQPDPNRKKATTLQIYEYDARNWARKQQSDFGWDWGPAYLPCGPLKPAYLIGLSGPPDGEDKAKVEAHPKDSQVESGVVQAEDSHAQSKSSPSDHSQLEPKVVFADDHHRSSKLTFQKRQAENTTASSFFWIHRTVIDIRRQGQRNNIPPDQQAAWIINITLPVTATRPLVDSVSLSGALAGTSVKLASTPMTVLQPAEYVNAGPDYLLTIEYTIDQRNIEMWYPASLGQPKLYNLELTLEVSNEVMSRQSKVSHQAAGSEKKSPSIRPRDLPSRITWYERVGFRTIVVDQSRYSDAEVARGIKPGTRFTFQINGKPFYVQGSSMIPIDNFAARANSSTIQWLLRSALLAHQNVVRIWGGAAYESDEFYDMCDELGILAWSESVFACGAYPISPASFLNNVRAEVAENVARLNRHPSTALWAGNNEGEGYLIAVNRTWPNGSIYFDQYDYLYNHVIRDVVLDNTRSISYMPSSTTQGYFTLDPYVSRYYNSTPGEIYGDQELYNYKTAVSFDTSTYPVARFVNEFGFHSMPSIYTWDRVLGSPEAYAFNSSVIRAHNKHNPAGSLAYPFPADDGQSQLTTAVTDYYPKPNITNDYRALLAQWAYSTQVFQAAYMASEIAYYRLGASRGENNMGALYWQLNDVWEGISWSSVEYTGRWKIFHYVAERVQDHVIISPMYNQTNQTLDIYVTSDLWQGVQGTAQWTWYDFAGKNLSGTTQDFSVGPLNSTRLYRSVGLSSIIPASQPANDAWLHLTMKSSDGKYFNEQFFNPIPLKDCYLRDTQVVSRAIGVNKVSIEVARGGVAAWVNVEHPPGVRGYFKDIKTGKPSNAFFLRPGEKRSLEFVLTGQDHEPGALESKMVVRTMWDNQHPK